MKVFAVKFSGFWPVGAGAVVVGSDAMTKEDAINHFVVKWAEHAAAKGYTGDKADPGDLTVTELDSGVTILADGDY